MKKIFIFILLEFLSHILFAQNNIHYSYDSFDRITKVVYPDSSFVSYVYDNSGNIISAINHDPCSTKPRPAITASGPITFCAGDSVMLTVNSPGYKHLWSTGDSVLSSIKITTSGHYAVSRTDTFHIYADTLQCQSVSDSVVVTVIPLPHVDTVFNHVVCNAAVDSVTFTSSDTGVTYSWTNSNTSIGLPGSGIGNIAHYTAINTTSVPVLAIVLVTPTRGGCLGPVRSFAITVNPTPNVATLTNQVLCNGTMTTAVAFSSSVAGTTFSWTNSLPAIGLPSSGVGSIASFTATDATTLPLISTVRVVASASSCLGLADSFTITVNPVPVVSGFASQSLCNSASSAPENFVSSLPATTTYSWTNSDPSIGLAASGTSNIPSFSAFNTSSAPITAIITVTPATISCTGVAQTFSITVNPIPDVAAVASQTLCDAVSTIPVVFSGSVSGTGYSWTNSDPSIGLGSAGTGNIGSFAAVNTSIAPVTANVMVTPSIGGCSGAVQSFSFTVNPSPGVLPLSNQSLCNGSFTAPVSISGPVPGTTYNWTNSVPGIGLASTGSGDIDSFMAVNATSAPITATIIVTPSTTSCIGAVQSFSITINPIPDVSPVSSPVVCQGASTTPVIFTGTVSGTLFTWTNSNSTIGLATTGTGNIGSFTAIDTSIGTAISDIVVTPSVGGCIGAVQSFSITVNPSPGVGPLTSQTLCNGAVTTPTLLTGPVPGTIFNWTNSAPGIGLLSSGAGDIASFTAIDTTSATVVATIVVTPSTTSCIGPVQTFSITVNPIPDVATVPNQTVCNGATTLPVAFAGLVLGAVYSWTNSDSTIGLVSTGTGNIGPFAAINTATTAVTATIVVTPSRSGCVGTVQTFSITVNPLPSVAPLSSQTLCNGDLTVPVSFTGVIPGTTYNWTNSAPGIGIASSGTGGIAAFTAVNSTSVPVVATVVVTPSTTSCVGPIQTFSITVKPTPSFTSIPNQSKCNGRFTDSVKFNGPVTGSVYSWTNDNPGIGLVSTGSGNITPFVAIDTTSGIIGANISVTPTANGCVGVVQTFSITVKPTPKLTSTLSASPVCSDIAFNYIPASATPGTTFDWYRPSAAGISNPASAGIDTIHELLINTTPNPVVVTYKDTLSANGCVNIQSITLTVNPTPVLNNILTSSICDSLVFSDTLSSATSGTTIKWFRAVATGISNLADSGLNIINEPLVNTMANQVVVIYRDSLFSNGCTNEQNIIVTVNPTPILTSSDTATACSGSQFGYVPLCTTPGTTFAWARPSVSGIAPIASSGSGSITDTLINSTLLPINVYYTETLTAFGCFATRYIRLTVNPIPYSPHITTKPPAVLCTNTQYQNFGADLAEPAGVTYKWTATNAEIWAQGVGRQYCLVNFPAPGNAVITLSANLTGINCFSKDTFAATVGPDVSDFIDVIYEAPQFICLKGFEDSYRWGVDNVSTLDSTIITGEYNQNYTNYQPDYTNNYYWVITTKNGCIQKSYENVPTGLNIVNGDVTTMKVYPNPAHDIINVEVSAAIKGKIEVQLFDMNGQKLKTIPAVNNKATIEIENIASGSYLIVGYNNDIRIGTAKFIKN